MKSLLIVDDEFSILETLMEIFGFEGYDVRTARNGLQALAEVRKFRPDLMLADYMMPHLDGVQLARKMRADPELKSIPIVLMSAAVVPTDNVAWEAFLSKPFDLDQLLETVAKYVS